MQQDSVYRRGGSTGYDVYPMPLPVDMSTLVPPPPAPIVPRFGRLSTVPGIIDVLRTARLYPDSRYRTSGYAEPGYSGASRNANSWW